MFQIRLILLLVPKHHQINFTSYGMGFFHYVNKAVFDAENENENENIYFIKYKDWSINFSN